MDRHLTALLRVGRDGPGRLRPVASGLWATPDEPLGGPANTCGFLIQRPAGNVFVYSCNAIADHVDHLDELGGVAMIVLNHRDEATRHVTTLAAHYDVRVHVHRDEVSACEARGVERIEALDGDHRFADDFHAWHAPGHTPGATAYTWHNAADGRTYLFTGDTFTNFPIAHVPRILGFHPYDGNVTDVRSTLARLRRLDTDVLVPGLANGTIHAYRWTTDERHRLLDHALSQLDDPAS